MRKLNEIITRISVWILKKIRWENTEFNQQTISTNPEQQYREI